MTRVNVTQVRGPAHSVFGRGLFPLAVGLKPHFSFVVKIKKWGPDSERCSPVPLHSNPYPNAGIPRESSRGSSEGFEGNIHFVIEGKGRRKEIAEKGAVLLA